MSEVTQLVDRMIEANAKSINAFEMNLSSTLEAIEFMRLMRLDAICSLVYLIGAVQAKLPSSMCFKLDYDFSRSEARIWFFSGGKDGMRILDLDLTRKIEVNENYKKRVINEATSFIQQCLKEAL